MTPTEAVPLALGIIALLTAIVGWLKWIRPRYRAGRNTVTAITETLLGRDEIVDAATGRVLVKKQPGMATRIDTVERALVALSDQHRTLDDHEKRITALEEATVERVVARQESALAWRAMETALKSTPDEEPEAE